MGKATATVNGGSDGSSFTLARPRSGSTLKRAGLEIVSGTPGNVEVLIALRAQGSSTLEPVAVLKPASGGDFSAFMADIEDPTQGEDVVVKYNGLSGVSFVATLKWDDPPRQESLSGGRHEDDDPRWIGRW